MAADGHGGYFPILEPDIKALRCACHFADTEGAEHETVLGGISALESGMVSVDIGPGYHGAAGQEEQSY